MAFNIVAEVNNTEYGSVTGSGSYAENEQVTLEVTPNSGYRFVSWSDGNTDNPRVIQATEDVTLTATLEAITEYTVTVNINDDTLGSVTGEGASQEGISVTIGSENRYAAGTQLKLTATPESGCKFVGWKINGADTTYDNPLLFDVAGDTTIEAQFANLEYYTVNIFSTDADYGSITIVSDIPPVNGKYQEGSQLIVTAVPSSTGKFLGWGDNFPHIPERTIYVDEDIFLRANFCSSEGPLLISTNTFKKIWASIKNFFSSSTGASKIGAPANNALGATTLADVVNSVGQANGLAQLNSDGKINISDLEGSSSSGLDVDITGNAATATKANSADVASKVGLATVGSSTSPVYINAGTPTACGGSLDVNITGSAATVTNPITTDKIAAKAVTAEKLSVKSSNGENLLFGTEDFSGSWYNKALWTEDGTYNGLKVMTRTDTYMGICQRHIVEAGHKYTFSAFVKNTTDNLQLIIIYGEDPAFAYCSPNAFFPSGIRDNFERVSATFTCTKSGVVECKIEMRTNTGSISVCGYKLEEGEFATPWTPRLLTPNTTTIDGGKITAKSVTDNQIADNAVTAEKLTVEAIAKPTGCIFELNAKGQSIADLVSGAVLPDSSGNNGEVKTTSTGISVINDSKHGHVYSFSANTGYIKGPILTPGKYWSVSCWFKHTNITGSYETILGLVGKNSAGYSFEIEGAIYSENIFYIHMTTIPRFNYTLGEWHHFVLTVSDNTVHLWFDGIDKGSGTVQESGRYCMDKTNIAIGSWKGSQLYTGQIANMRIYGRVLSDEEALTLYKLGTDTESGQITADRIAKGAVTADKLADGAVTPASIGAAASSHTHTTGTWNNKADNRDYFCAFSQDNQWNFDVSGSYTYNPSTKVLKAGSFSLGGNCTLKYDSTNQCLNFVFS